MRHPLRRTATQGAWYALGNAVAKLSGLLLLPIMTNTRLLSVAAYGRWGVFEVTTQLAIGILGLFSFGLLRYVHEPGAGGKVVAAAWWGTVALALAGAVAGLGALEAFAPSPLRPAWSLLVAYVVLELLLLIPQTLLRSEERAGWYTTVQALKLALIVSLSYLFLARKGLGLMGVVEAYAAASAVGLAAAVAGVHRREFLWPRVEAQALRTILRYSAPLVIGGLGSILLNAGDRYVLAGFRPPEDVGVYTLATKFGGVVNMFIIQPLNLAWLPLLFRLEEGQRPHILQLMVPYLVFALCLAVVGLSLGAAPALHLMRSSRTYDAAVPLIPWVALGFAAYGMATVFSGVLALFQQTRTLSLWLMVAALANLALNFALVPALGPLAAALNTLIGYLVLLAGQFHAAQKCLRVSYPWGRLTGVAVLSLLVSLAGARIRIAGFALDLCVRAGLLAGWAVVLIATRWFTVAEVREAWRALRHKERMTPVPPVPAAE